MKKLALIGLGIAVLAAAAPEANARPDSRTMTCGQVTAMVRQYKAVVMSTGRYTYDRIVSQFGFCGPTQKAVSAIVPAIDTPSCKAGYKCEEDPFK